MFAGLFMHSWFPGTPGVIGIVVIVLVGALIGLLNGFSVGVLGVNPFLQTLTFYIIFGQGVQVLSSLSITDLPESYLYLGGNQLGPVPVATILLVALFLIAWFALKYTRTGIAIYSVGGDKDAAREAGINTTQIVLLVYVLSGALAGLAGLIYTGYLGAVTPTLASGALFPAFAAAVIGGISLFGGRGNILGGLGGVLLLSTIQAGLVMLGIDPKLVKVINGVILLGAVLLYTGEAQLRRRLLTE